MKTAPVVFGEFVDSDSSRFALGEVFTQRVEPFGRLLCATDGRAAIVANCDFDLLEEERAPGRVPNMQGVLEHCNRDILFEWPYPEIPLCSTCAGSSRIKQERCEECNGDGLCNTCEGGGVDECECCGAETDCDTCEGSGKCYECRGNFEPYNVRCSDCEGRFVRLSCDSLSVEIEERYAKALNSLSGLKVEAVRYAKANCCCLAFKDSQGQFGVVMSRRIGDPQDKPPVLEFSLEPMAKNYTDEGSADK